MMKLPKSLLAGISLLVLHSSLQAKSLDEIIAAARSQLAPEKTLKAVKTLEYNGVVENADGSTAKLTLIFKKPYNQFLEVEHETAVDTTAVNGYEGWNERITVDDPYKSGVRVLSTNQVQYLISNATENLYFFEGPKQITGAKMELLGEKNKLGKQCWEVSFAYPSGLLYMRYFDKATGKLVATTTQNGAMEMVEKDTVTVDGINFPKSVETYENGKLVRTVTFESIKVNEEVPSDLFDFPTLPKPKTFPQ